MVELLLCPRSSRANASWGGWEVMQAGRVGAHLSRECSALVWYAREESEASILPHCSHFTWSRVMTQPAST